jgi:hypothetical protein
MFISSSLAATWQYGAGFAPALHGVNHFANIFLRFCKRFALGLFAHVAGYLRNPCAFNRFGNSLVFAASCFRLSHISLR